MKDERSVDRGADRRKPFKVKTGLCLVCSVRRSYGDRESVNSRVGKVSLSLIYRRVAVTRCVVTGNCLSDMPDLALDRRTEGV